MSRARWRALLFCVLQSALFLWWRQELDADMPACVVFSFKFEDRQHQCCTHELAYLLAEAAHIASHCLTEDAGSWRVQEDGRGAIAAIVNYPDGLEQRQQCHGISYSPSAHGVRGSRNVSVRSLSCCVRLAPGACKLGWMVQGRWRSWRKDCLHIENRSHRSPHI